MFTESIDANETQKKGGAFRRHLILSIYAHLIGISLETLEKDTNVVFVEVAFKFYVVSHKT
jgi:hypothetical protein